MIAACSRIRVAHYKDFEFGDRRRAKDGASCVRNSVS